MFKILICDDEKNDAEVLRMHMEKYAEEHTLNCSMTVSEDPADIMNDGESYDIALLDVQTGEISGLQLAEELKRRNKNTAFFFITNYNGYQDEAMDLRAFRFLIKPIELERLYSGLDKAFEYINNFYGDVFIFAGAGDGAYRRIDINDIIYVMIESRRAVIITADGRAAVRESFDDICSMLPERFFFRIHKSYIVNMHYITEYKYKKVIMSNGESLSVAPRRQTEFHRYWFEYMERR